VTLSENDAVAPFVQPAAGAAGCLGRKHGEGTGGFRRGRRQVGRRDRLIDDDGGGASVGMWGREGRTIARRRAERVHRRHRVQKDVATAELGELTEITGDQSAVHAQRAARNAAMRSRIASATSLFN
jgi:hypothetical protein